MVRDHELCSLGGIVRETEAMKPPTKSALGRCDALAQYDLASNLEWVQCPVLVIWGDHFFVLKGKRRRWGHK